MKKLLLLSILFIPHFLSAQSAIIPLGNEGYYEFLDRMEIKSGRFFTDVYTSTKPYLRENVIKSISNFDTLESGVKISRSDYHNLEYVEDDNTEWVNSDTVLSKAPFLKHFYQTKSDLYSTKSKDFMLKINPVIALSAGKDNNSKELMFSNTRGVDVRGWINKKVGFYLFIGENQARYPVYIQKAITKFNSVPGEGYYKPFHLTGVDYLTTHGYIDFKVAKFITVTFGQDKNSFGDGYRSLFLSDFSQDYPFLKLNTQVWKLNYTNIFTDLTADFKRGPDTLLQHKYADFHHLSLNVTKFLNVGLFEAVVFNRNSNYEISYLNPLIFYRSVEQGLGSPDNAFMGADIKANLFKHISIYGQLLLDDLNLDELKAHKGYWGNKYGAQIGLKYIDAFFIPNLDLQLEHDFAVPYTYTHNDLANYTNYDQPMADPLGANFNETIIIVNYRPIKKLLINIKYFHDLYGQDSTITKGKVVSDVNYGANIDIPTSQLNIPSPYNNKIGQGIKTHLNLIDITISYMLFHNLFIDFEYITRNQDADYKPQQYSSKTHFYSLGFRLNLAKKSLDY